MNKFILFAILSLPVIAISWRSLFSIHRHGFYRFFGWEGILWLLVSNYKYWFADALSPVQCISWILLILGGFIVVSGMITFSKAGKADASREDEALFGFEKTTKLVDQGIYKYIRHPLYGSLILLTWGIFFKNVNLELLVIALLSTLFFYITSRYDEKECLAYFGDVYREYMNRTRMFVPYLL